MGLFRRPHGAATPHVWGSEAQGWSSGALWSLSGAQVSPSAALAGRPIAPLCLPIALAGRPMDLLSLPVALAGRLIEHLQRNVPWGESLA